jgi:hypothetical protein
MGWALDARAMSMGPAHRLPGLPGLPLPLVAGLPLAGAFLRGLSSSESSISPLTRPSSRRFLSAGDDSKSAFHLPRSQGQITYISLPCAPTHPNHRRRSHRRSLSHRRSHRWRHPRSHFPNLPPRHHRLRLPPRASIQTLTLNRCRHHPETHVRLEDRLKR